MFRVFLRAKVYPLVVTEKHFEYDGSLGLSKELMEAAGLLPGEKVLVINENTGIRYETYLIEDERPGVCSVQGTGCRYSEIGDKLMLFAWRYYDPVTERVVPAQLTVKVDGNNRIITTEAR